MITELEKSEQPAVGVADTYYSPTSTEQADPRRWKALPVALLAAVMDLIDASIVILALPISVLGAAADAQIVHLVRQADAHQ